MNANNQEEVVAVVDAAIEAAIERQAKMDAEEEGSLEYLRAAEY